GFFGGDRWRTFSNTRDLTLSALWSIYGGTALAVGIVRNLKALRFAALLLLAAVGTKLLFLDLQYYSAPWHLPVFNSTFGAFATFVGACAMGALFYARAKNLDESESTVGLLFLAGAANLFAIIAFSAEAVGYFDRIQASVTGEAVRSAEEMKQF